VHSCLTHPLFAYADAADSSDEVAPNLRPRGSLSAAASADSVASVSRAHNCAACPGARVTGRETDEEWANEVPVNSAPVPCHTALLPLVSTFAADVCASLFATEATTRTAHSHGAGAAAGAPVMHLLHTSTFAALAYALTSRTALAPPSACSLAIRTAQRLPLFFGAPVTAASTLRSSEPSVRPDEQAESVIRVAVRSQAEPLSISTSAVTALISPQPVPDETLQSLRPPHS